MQYDFDTVINRRGSNSYKWDAAEWLVENGYTERFDNDTIAAFTADMDFRCAQPIIDAMKRTADYGIFGYTAVETNHDYYEAIINWFDMHHHWKISREWILYANGTINALSAAIHAFSEKGDGIILMRPVYTPFTTVIEEAGRRVVNCPLINDGNGYYTIDFEMFEVLATMPRNKIFILCSPHNPVGRVWNVNELSKIGEICKKNHVLIVADEIHGDLIREGVTFHPMATVLSDRDILVTLTSVNKTFNLAGLEITNIVVENEKLREQLRKMLGESSPSQFSMAALIAAYTEGDEWLVQLKKYLDGNIDWVIGFLHEYLPEVVCWRPEGTYVVWMDFRGTGYSEEEIHQKIYVEANVLLEGGRMFDPEAGSGFERICVPMSRMMLKKAFYRIAAAFEKVSGDSCEKRWLKNSDKNQPGFMLT